MNALAEYVAGCKGRRVFQHLRSVNAVLHCTLVHNGTVRRCIRVGATSPKCATDQYALGLCRAYAGVILTTARILRAEPTMTTSYDPGWEHPMGAPGIHIGSRARNGPLQGHRSLVFDPARDDGPRRPTGSRNL
ncbi:Uncharacterized protein PBTT_01483 [Plasmodiophora brassicae]|uniref:Uncharacterized protein n=1 Tax=Plasmodiophora brassicae TaxID=37360 RepID=A0A3P3Y2J8_PLABS|nr:unnamed protein product [Plasmodiophora brassicae]